MKWEIEYNNDTGLRDDSFQEWWMVSGGNVSFGCYAESEAIWLRDKLNSESTPSKEFTREDMKGFGKFIKEEVEMVKETEQGETLYYLKISDKYGHGISSILDLYLNNKK